MLEQPLSDDQALAIFVEVKEAKSHDQTTTSNQIPSNVTREEGLFNVEDFRQAAGIISSCKTLEGNRRTQFTAANVEAPLNACLVLIPQ